MNLSLVARLRPLIAAGGICLGAGCITLQPMPTPNLFLGEGGDGFALVPHTLQSSQIDVLYATDRAPEQDKDGRTYYGAGRSASLALGVARVQMGKDLDWPELVELSRVDHDERDRKAELIEAVEFARFPDTQNRLGVNNGVAGVRPEIAEQESAVVERLHAELSARLAHTPRKEVVLFVHGINTAFRNDVAVMAQLWHFMGRFGIPVVYAWPAGRGGLRGYATDRESGEFTVFHLKQFLRALADCPDVERIHVIAHSRGSDVILTALRELTEYYRGVDETPGASLKLGNLILAAPDLDWQVFVQRVAAEQLLAVADRTTIYLSPDDKAIRLATILFDSGRRLGRLFVADLSDQQRDLLAGLRNISVVDARISQGDFFGHGYFYANRAVSSDLILVLRDDRDPGAEHGRPLEREESVFWRIRDDYLLED